MWRLEILRKHSQIIIIIYKDNDYAFEDDYDDSENMQDNSPRGQIIVDDEEDIDKWKDAIMKLNSLS
jgi:hypothetical protein